MNLFTILKSNSSVCTKVASRIGAESSSFDHPARLPFRLWGFLLKQRGTYQYTNPVSPFLSEEAPDSVFHGSPRGPPLGTDGLA